MDMDQQIFDGMEVYDCDGLRIGKVTRYNTALGYFETQGTFSGPRYVPVYAIERVGPTGAYLNVTKGFVSDVYNHMPSVRPDFTPEGTLTGGGTAESGYTARRVPLDADALQVVREKIHVGTDVFDSEGLKLGRVQAYDPATGYMRIEKGAIVPKQIFLPVTSVGFLDDRGIHVTLTKDSIQNRFERVPEVAKEFFARS